MVRISKSLMRRKCNEKCVQPLVRLYKGRTRSSHSDSTLFFDGYFKKVKSTERPRWRVLCVERGHRKQWWQEVNSCQLCVEDGTTRDASSENTQDVACAERQSIKTESGQGKEARLMSHMQKCGAGKGRNSHIVAMDCVMTYVSFPMILLCRSLSVAVRSKLPPCA